MTTTIKSLLTNRRTTTDRVQRHTDATTMIVTEALQNPWSAVENDDVDSIHETSRESPGETATGGTLEGDAATVPPTFVE